MSKPASDTRSRILAQIRRLLGKRRAVTVAAMARAAGVSRQAGRKRAPAAVPWLAGAVAFSLMGDMTVYAVLPVHYAAFGLVPIQVGLLLSANRWIRLLTNQFARRMLARTSPAALLSAALLAGAGICAFYGLRPGFAAFLAARVTWGLCWSFIRHAGVTRSVGGAASATVGHVLGLYIGIVQLGFIAGTLAGGLLFDLAGGSRAFFVLAAVSLAAVPLGARGAAGPPFREPPRRSAGTRAGSLAPRVAVQGFVSACVGTGLIMSTVGFVLKSRFGESLSLGPFVLGMTTVSAVLMALRYGIDSFGSPVLGRLIDAIGARRAETAAFAAGAASLLAAGVLARSAAVVPLVVAFLAAASTCSLALQVDASVRGPRSYARLATATDLGGAVGPLLGWAGIQAVATPEIILVAGGALFALAALLGAAAADERIAAATPRS